MLADYHVAMKLEKTNANRFRGEVRSEWPPITIYMPDGTPAPYMLTTEEAIRFLRLDCLRFPRAALSIRQRRGLRGVQMGKRVCFRLDDVLAFLDLEQKRNAR